MNSWKVHLRRGGLVLAIGALGLGTGMASADTSKVGVNLSLQLKRSPTGDKVSGKVSSKLNACRANRKVRLYHRTVSEESDAAVVATLRTDNKGKWTFRPNKNQAGDRFATPGKYHVGIGEVRIGAITCKEKFSSSLFIG